MAQYKVPQDVEADDKLLGPFSFRQFVYLLIVAGLIALAVGLFQIFPLLVIIPLPLILLFAALALPIKKDQPMETYLAAIVSYYLKPRTRFWMSGQRESTIDIIAPKTVEEVRTRDITGEEATHRLSFLADIVDTEGYAIKGTATNPMRDDLIAEANATADMFETDHFNNLEGTIEKDEGKRYREVINEMRAAIEKNDNLNGEQTIKREFETDDILENRRVPVDSPVVVQPDLPAVEKLVEKPEKVESTTTNHSIMELANNPVFSVETIAKEANRIKERDEGEVFISLH
ncbi:PrgI family protein [Candidatus Saccharibacteria bacterium]|nr:PrgI family protein [Candidatus Saccharibacteria bacterium]